MFSNDIVKHKDFYVSVAFRSQYEGNRRIDETALVFEENGKSRFWILKHDVREIYNGLSLEEAKNKFREEREKGNQAFWSDYSEETDSSN